MTPDSALMLGVPAGGWLVALTTITAAALTAFGVVRARRSREPVSMATAWDRIERLERDHDAMRRAMRILEEGFDAFWSWRQRVRAGAAARGAEVPAFTEDEDRAIRRARRSLELADTGPTPVPPR